MQIILAVEVRMERSRKIANRTRQISDGCLSVTGSRRIDCHWQVVCHNGLETQSSLAASPTVRFCGVAAGRRIRSFFIL
jgi:hypothetical protein